MESLVLDALAKTYGFRGWQFENEFEFKHELFHQLAGSESNGVSLVSQVPGTPSCRLHSEGKVLNGNAHKADLLICDPSRRQKFNYEVEYIIELKQTLSDRVIRDEVEKFRTYGRTFSGFFLASDRVSVVPDAAPTVDGQKVYVLHRKMLAPVEQSIAQGVATHSFESSLGIVRQALDDTLMDYARGRAQYHSFFWCNYEHEEWRRHSFPVEGDFNAHFYHRLRNRLPPGVEIRSEAHPPGDTVRRIDLLVRSRPDNWAIPIDVKMNWDQFKPRYKAGSRQPEEASVILGRLDAIRRNYAVSCPMVVVVQGAWQLPRDVRSTAMPLLERASFPIELIAYDEAHERIDRRQLGPTNFSPLSH